MLAQWLQLYPTATWNELFEAINCCTKSSGKDDDQTHPSSNNMQPASIQSHSNHLKHRYKRTRFSSEQEEWPPDQPKHFTSLALIHHNGGLTERDDIVITQTIQNTDTNVDKSQDKIIASKEIKEIFASSEDGHEPYIILIEGAPGIGKTVLSKEMAFRWANGQLLVNTILLFLIFLRDPLVKTLTSLKEFVKYYYQHEENSETIADSCADYLLHSDGECVTFVFDGYDEYPENLRQNSFISDILQHKVLPACQLVVTSRPHASAHLRGNCDRYVKVLGFTKEDRQDYIINSLKGKQQDIDKLVEYLDKNLTISSLCYIPFNMTVLLWLYKQGIVLANSSTELYNYFICHTIRHHLAKVGISVCDDFEDLSSLEEPYRQVIQRLSFLSYKALEKKQLTFTLNEIKTICPQIEEITGALNGFGLLQTAEHFTIKKNITLNFIHFSVQEFLAAYHITCLPHYEEFCALKQKFMSHFYVNTFTMYVGMTKGQRPAFKQYLNGSGDWTAYMYGLFGRFSPLNLFSPNIRINPQLVADMRTCFRLFKCFHEAGDEVLCNEIGTAHFSIGRIDVHETLLPSEMEDLGIFLCSKKEWQALLYRYIDDVGIQVLHQLLTNKTRSTCIHELHIYNYSISWSNSTGKVSSYLITEIVKSCKIKSILLPALLLEDVLSLKNQLTTLAFYVENYTAVTTLVPTLLLDNKVLKVLILLYSKSSKDSIKALVETLKCSYIVELSYAEDRIVEYHLKNENVKVLSFICVFHTT